MNMLTTSWRALRDATTMASACAVIVGLLAMLPLQLQAQTREADSKELMTKEQQQQLRRVLQSADAKITAGFAGQEKLKEEMQSQLKAIENIKDTGARSKAIAAFQDKYKPAYSGILQKSGLTLQDLANQLQPIFPDLVLQVTDRLTIIGRARNAPPTRQQVRPAPTATTHDISAGDFTVQRNSSCALAAGGGVTSTSSSIKATSLSAVAGGCTNEGTMLANIPLPAERKKATLSGTADLSTDALAVGVLGSAGASARAAYRLQCDNEIVRVDVDALVIAPVAWVGTQAQSLEGAQVTLDAPATATQCDTKLIAYTSTISLVGGSSSNSSLRRIKASLTLEPS